MEHNRMESLLELLHAASYTTDSSKQQQITQGMDNFLRQTPLAHRYLLRVFLPQSGVRDNCGDPAVRAMAGIVLKNVLGAIEEPLETLLPFIKGECDLLNSLEEANPLVRGTAASLLASIAGSLLSKGLLFKLWPELLEDLLKMIKIKRSLGAASALCQICEDWETPLRNQHFEEPIIDTLVAIDIGWASRLFDADEAIDANLERVVTSILETIGHLILAPCVDTKLDAIVAALARHASRNSTVIKCAVCRLATRLINSQGTSVEIVSVVADFMMQAMLSFGCSELSLEATEFWHEVAQQEEYENSILSQIPGLLNRLIEALLLRIRWDPKADEDILSEYEKIDSATDSQAALLPRSRRSNGSMAEHDNSFNDIEFTDSTTTKDDDDESDSEYEEEIDGWSPRKCAGSTIDILAGALGLPFASMILPQIANLLGSIEWPAMEAAILALGAIAEGCGPAVQPHLSQILPILTERCLTSSGDSPAALKAVAAWTLSRYAEWMEETLGGQAIRSLSETIRKSSSIRVRSAACSALASIVERGPTTLLSPQIFDGIVCPALNEALISYQSSKTRSILYDAIGAVAEIHAVTCLLPAIQNAWMKECLLDTTFLSSLTYDTLLTPNDKSVGMLQGLYPLLDCTCQIIASADLRKEDFFIFANSIFPLVVGISLTIGSFVVANSANPSSVSLQETILSYESEYDILVVVLDLLASFFSLCSGESTSILIESKFIQTIVSMQIQIQLALSLAFRSSTDVRQSAFAVVGEVCRSIDLMVPIFGQNQDLLSLILRAMVISFDPESPSANTSCASNALWALSLLYTSYSSKPMQSDLNSNYQRTIQSAYVNFRLTGLTKSLDILLLAHSVHILTILTPLLMSSVSPGPKNLLIRSRRLPASYLDNLACAYGSVLGFTLLMSDRSLKISVVNENCLRCWCTLILAVPCVSERETTVLSVVNGIFQIDEPVNHEIAELIADLLRNFLQRSNTTRLFQESVAKFNA